MRPLLARILSFSLSLSLRSLSSVFVTGCYPLLSRIIGSFLSFLYSFVPSIFQQILDACLLEYRGEPSPLPL